MTGRMLAIVAALVMAAGCAEVEKTGTGPPDAAGKVAKPVAPAGAVVVEVETAKLTDAKVVALPGGGKGILIPDENREAVVTVPMLEKGKE